MFDSALAMFDPNLRLLVKDLNAMEILLGEGPEASAVNLTDRYLGE